MNAFWDQREVFCMTMPVDLNRWRATIGCFRASILILSPLIQIFSLTSFLVLVLVRLFCFCYGLLTVLIPVLPIVLAIHFLSFHCPTAKVCFFFFLFCMHLLAKTVVYTTAVILKRIHLIVSIFAQHKCSAFKPSNFPHAYFNVTCIICSVLHIQWLVHRAILLSGDIEINPGPATLDFCCWNLNSIAAYDFLRVSLIEAYNSVFNYDLIAIAETHIDSTIDEGRLALDGYSFIKGNHPHNVKKGGVGLYVKDSLPSKARSDLAILPECIVHEIHLNKKKYFFAVVYRSPSQNETEFENFMMNFELMLSKMNAENPFSVIITGDFNCRSTQWWENDIENNEGKLFELLTSDLGLHQLISEPTHLIGSSKSCIDLIFTDQPNLLIASGVHPSLHAHCHHQIIYGKLSVSNTKLPPYKRRIWYYDNANFVAVRKSIEMFHWQEHLGNLKCPNEQVALLNEVLLNIYSNFIPNKVKTIRPHQAPWITDKIKIFLRKKNRAYRKFVKNGQPIDKLEEFQQMISDGSKLIEDSKRNYFLKTGNTLASPGTSNKKYWSLINTVLNRGKIPIIPPLLENGLFISDFTEKAQIFNDYFLLQCTTIDTGSRIPLNFPNPSTFISDVPVSDEKILNIIRSLNPNKAHGWDGISVRMIKLSDTALITPLKIIFTNCLKRGLFPEIWKYANVVPVHKKNEKNLKENYRPISLLPIFGKILEKLMYDALFSHLISCNLLNPNQSGFRPGDSTINQLISITHTIFNAFDCNPPLDVRSVYLDISKAFDRVWHDGLIYKLKRNGVSGDLLLLIQSFLKDRRQRTVLNGQNSLWGDVSAGVPQGSILGPLFFLVYINDLAVDVKCSVKLFADDASLFTIVEDINSAAIDINHDLEIINKWAFDWKMSFNPDPRKQAVELKFSMKRVEVNHPEIRFNNIPLASKAS